jgi:hypothetical protein
MLAATHPAVQEGRLLRDFACTEGVKSTMAVIATLSKNINSSVCGGGQMGWAVLDTPVSLEGSEMDDTGIGFPCIMNCSVHGLCRFLNSGGECYRTF